jgi:ubiquinone/menaquinone biosynthesis C-methylase UbiE
VFLLSKSSILLLTMNLNITEDKIVICEECSVPNRKRLFPEMDKRYTDLWINNFGESDVLKYHNKFIKCFQKHLKHYQQIKFISKYLHEYMAWLDAPIGSGRLMDSIRTKKMYGFDISSPFIHHNFKKGIKTCKGNLFNMPFKNKFDIITCLHTLPAFSDFPKILKQLMISLKPGGVLICDIVNKNHITYSNFKLNYQYDDPCMSKPEIISFFNSIGCTTLAIQPHDLFDNRFCGDFYNSKFNKIPLKVFNRCYFNFKLHKLIDKLSINKNDKLYIKYLVAVRKRKPGFSIQNAMVFNRQKEFTGA